MNLLPVLTSQDVIIEAITSEILDDRSAYRWAVKAYMCYVHSTLTVKQYHVVPPHK